MILRIALLLVACVLMNSNVSAQQRYLPEQPSLVVELLPEETHTGEGTYVHAHLRMNLRLSGRYAYEALEVTLPTIPNSEVIEIQRPRTRFIDTYTGAGHIYEATYSIFPQRSGVLEIPPVRVRGSVETEVGRELHFDLASEGFRVPVDPAVEGFSGNRWFVADAVEISETWTPPIGEIRYGDVVRREVHVKADGTTGGRMPVLETPRATGVTQFDAGHRTKTEKTVSGTIGHLWQSWEVRIDNANFAETAPVRLVFWNAREHAEEIAWIPVRRIEPLPPDTGALASKLMDEAWAEHQLQWTLWLELLVLLAAPFVLLAVLFLHALLPTIRDLVLYFRLGRTAPPREAFEAVQIWSGKADIRASDDSELLNDLRALDAAIFSNTRKAFQGRRLAWRCLRQTRSKRIARYSRRLGTLIDGILGKRTRLEQISPVENH